MRAEARRYPADAKDAREAGSSVVSRWSRRPGATLSRHAIKWIYFGARPAARERRRQAPSGRVAARTTGC